MHQPQRSAGAVHPTARRRASCPLILQIEAEDCGAAALGMVLGYHGRHIALAELRVACGTATRGTDPDAMVAAAATYGLESRMSRIGVEDLPGVPLPFIAIWDEARMVVVENLATGWYDIVDPAEGARRIRAEEFGRRYRGAVIEFEPGFDFVPGGMRPSALRGFRDWLRGSEDVVLFSFLSGVALLVPALAIPICLQLLVDQVLIRGQVDWLWRLVLFLAAAATVGWIVASLQSRVFGRLRMKLSIARSTRFLWHVLRLPLGFFTQKFGAESATRLSLGDSVAFAIASHLYTVPADLFAVLVFAAVMFMYDPLLAAIALTLTALPFVVLRWTGRRRIADTKRLGLEYGKASGAAIACFQNIETIKAAGMENDVFARWAGFYSQGGQTRQSLGEQDTYLAGMSTLAGALTTVAVLIVGGFRVMDGFLSLGMLVAFLSLTGSFLGPVSRLAGVTGALQAVSASIGRMAEIEAVPADPLLAVEDGSDLLPDEEHRLSGQIELRGVSFGYDPLAPPLLSEFSFAVRPGQRIGVLGRSGAGKSTLARLVAGLHEPWDGSISYDGTGRLDIPRRVFTSSVAIVEQERMLFTGTVRDNLTLWDPGVPDRELVRACRDAAIHEVVVSLPGSYDAPLLPGGMNLSEGQRQRLDVARALVGSPAILILDEALSAVEPETEQTILTNLRRRGCTTLIVSNRLATLRGCDEVIVLYRGRIVERGHADVLLRSEGPFFDLMRAQIAEARA